MRNKDCEQQYFEWLCSLVCDNRYSFSDYTLLLRHLYNREFTFTIPMDENRYNDGINLRYIFKTRHRISTTQIDRPFCSVLEMMVALARRVEDTIMTDDSYGDRAPIWFWSMMESLGLIDYDDDNFYYNEEDINNIIDIFLYRTYDRCGYGGLFTVKHPRRDMRDVEIWLQLMWWLKERGD